MNQSTEGSFPTEVTTCRCWALRLSLLPLGWHTWRLACWPVTFNNQAQLLEQRQPFPMVVCLAPLNIYLSDLNVPLDPGRPEPIPSAPSQMWRLGFGLMLKVHFRCVRANVCMCVCVWRVTSGCQETGKPNHGLFKRNPSFKKQMFFCGLKDGNDLKLPDNYCWKFS